MGLFFTTIICRGFRIPYLVGILPTISKKWIIRDTRDIIFACPSTIKPLDSLGPCIDSSDISQGFVAMDELVKSTNLSLEHFQVNE
jgi:hypothetical protein